MIRPPLLREGDAVVSPASSVPALRPGRFERGVRALEVMGFRVHVGRNARDMPATPRAPWSSASRTCTTLSPTEEVRAIICSIGGYNSNHPLHRLDYDLIQDNPKGMNDDERRTALSLGGPAR